MCFGAAANAGCSPEKFFACFDLCWCNVCFAGRHKEVAMELLKNGGATQRMVLQWVPFIREGVGRFHPNREGVEGVDVGPNQRPI